MRWRWWRANEGPTGPAVARDELLSAWLDGALDTADAARAEAGIASDPAARDALDGLRRVRDGLRALGEVSAPRSFAIAAEAAPRPSGLPRLELATRLGAALSAVALAAVIGLPVITGTSSDDASFGVASTASQQTAGAAQLAEPQASAATLAAAESQSSTATAGAATPAAALESAAPPQARGGTPAAALASAAPPQSDAAADAARDGEATPPAMQAGAAEAQPQRPGAASDAGSAASTPTEEPATGSATGETRATESAGAAPVASPEPAPDAPQSQATAGGQSPELQRTPEGTEKTAAEAQLEAVEAQITQPAPGDGSTSSTTAAATALSVATALLAVAAGALWLRRRRLAS